ncbi:hypothetical protein PYR71_14855 [Rhizobium sp. MC63]|uniref:Uncharacterized protein n=1 Tax=Rhizobium mulingense TaxID=3031128 RepID=A0ACC6MZ36_9HYPH|nr:MULTISPECIES: hypothetical protein [unclassified Rhizobium]MDF0697761.1 hypothetical protein [Rhizobium sp. MC63]MEA3518609.1 hypothetical protein [Rhizobium sp. MJ31]
MNTCGEENDIIPNEMIEKLLRDLTDVGPLKPIGYLPRSTIKRFLKTTSKALAASLVKRGLAVAEFTTRHSMIHSGALYVYDRNALDSLIREQAEAVQAAGLPLNADSLVAHIAAVFYDLDHPAHGIIATAFGERSQVEKTGATRS